MPVSTAQGYQHSLSEIRDYVRALLMQSSGDSHWTDARIDKFIQLALDDMRLRDVVQIATYSFYSTADLQTWTPQSDVWKITRIDYDDERLEQITQHDFDELTAGDWDVNSGAPERWYDDGTYIWFDRKCSDAGKTIRIYYWKRPQDLSADTDLTGFYKAMLPVVAYRTAQLAKAADEKASHSIWKAEFDEAIHHAQLHIMRLHESDAILAHDPVGWDDYN